MNLKISAVLLLILLSAGGSLCAKEREVSLQPTERPGAENEDVERVARIDTNGDGAVDMLVAYDAEEKKVWEALDYNRDGELDDFYYYAAGVLIRQEVDSNYDGKIDLWCSISEGIYVESYMQDVDFDGQVDRKKYFD